MAFPTTLPAEPASESTGCESVGVLGRGVKPRQCGQPGILAARVRFLGYTTNAWLIRPALMRYDARHAEATLSWGPYPGTSSRPLPAHAFGRAGHSSAGSLCDPRQHPQYPRS